MECLAQYLQISRSTALLGRGLRDLEVLMCVQCERKRLQCDDDSCLLTMRGGLHCTCNSWPLRSSFDPRVSWIRPETHNSWLTICVSNWVSYGIATVDTQQDSLNPWIVDASNHKLDGRYASKVATIGYYFPLSNERGRLRWAEWTHWYGSRKHSRMWKIRLFPSHI
jgi:hypothetical protein